MQVLDLVASLASNNRQGGGTRDDSSTSMSLDPAVKQRTLSLPPPWNVLPNPNDPMGKQDLMKFVKNMEHVLKLKKATPGDYFTFRSPFIEFVHKHPASGPIHALALRFCLTGGECEKFLRSSNNTYEDYCRTIESMEQSLAGPQRFHDFYAKQLEDLPVCSDTSLNAFNRLIQVCDQLFVATEHEQLRSTRSHHTLGKIIFKKFTYNTVEQFNGWLERHQKPEAFELENVIQWLRTKKIPSIENYRDLHGFPRSTAEAPSTSGPRQGGIPSVTEAPASRGRTSTSSRPSTNGNGNSGSNGGGSRNGNGNGGSNGGGFRTANSHLTSTIPQMDGNDSLPSASNDDSFGNDPEADLDPAQQWHAFALRLGKRISEKDPCPPSLCNGAKHLIIDCEKFLALTPAQRWDIIAKKEGRCISCFRLVHPKDGKCKGRPCKKCKGQHHHLLCGSRPEHFQKQVRANVTRTANVPDYVDEERGQYMMDVYSDYLESDSPATDENIADESFGGISPPVGGDLHNGEVQMGPSVANLNSLRTTVHNSFDDDVARNMARLTEAQLTSYVTPEARQ